MELNMQTALLNVGNLKQSIEFYQAVFDFRVTSQREEVAALMIHEKSRRQVLLLREISRQAHHAGRRSIGLRMLSFEAGSLDELDVIEQRLLERNALIWSGQTETYRALFSLDPDRIDISVASSLTGAPISSEDWNHLDDAIYAID
jgi:catechol-2,3-dioxygenase